MARIRVLIADDSLTIRHHLAEVIASDLDFELVGEARDGEEAVALCQRLRPHVVTLDMSMPCLDGLAATKRIMRTCATPILIVSSSVNRGEALRTFDAIAAGAVDVLEKPGALTDLQEWALQFRAQLRLIARIQVITRFSDASTMRRTPEVVPPVTADTRSRQRLVALGASTGGPMALHHILSNLPATFPVPILLVIHMSPLFTAAFVTWLAQNSRLPVRMAVDGERLPQPGTGVVLMPGPDCHLVMDGVYLRQTAAPERWSCRPSVDELFLSLTGRAADLFAGLLTGMGRDGAAGLLALRQAGAVTAAQDEASSVIFGMPREAIALGAAEHILPLADFTNAMIQHAACTVNT